MADGPMWKIENFNQIGVAVKDAEAAAKYVDEKFGIKCLVLTMPSAKAFLRGKEVDFVTKIAIARVGSIDLEMMEIVEGDHIVKEFLGKHGPGLHHLGIYVDDLNAAVKQWEEKGGKLVQRTAHSDGIGTAYLDAESELGTVYVELIKLA